MPRPTRRPRIGFNPLLQREVRQSARRQRLGPDPRCGCGESRPPALERDAGVVRCYRCSTGRPTEEDHPFGHTFEHVTQTIDANDHRLLSDVDFGRDVRLQGLLADDARELLRRLRGR